jgi:Two component regulator propeller
MKLRFYLLSLCFFAVLSLQAQDTLSELKINDWKQHLPWQRARWVTQSEDKMYIATEWAIVEVDKDERSHKFLTKVEGLAENGIGFIKYLKSKDLLFVVYANSNLDVVKKDGSIVNLPLIKNNPNIIGDKRIYSLYEDGNFVWMSCGFGMVKLNMTTLETELTIFTSSGANSFAQYQGKYYMALEDGMYTVSDTEPNPQDFSKWQKLSATQGWAASIKPKFITEHDGKLYFGSDKSIYNTDGTDPEVFITDAQKDVYYISKEGPGLVMGFRKDFTGPIRYLKPDGQVVEIQQTCDVIRPIYAVEATAGTFWYADESDGFFTYDLAANRCDQLKFDSPYFHRVKEIVITDNGTVLVATPGPPSNLGPVYLRDGIYAFKDNKWSRIYGDNTPILVQNECHFDMWRVAPIPKTDDFYAGSWIGGLSEIKETGAAACFTQYNSLLGNAGTSGTNRTAIGGLDFDDDGNLWISNYGSSKPIAVRKPDGTFQRFTAPNVDLLSVTIDQNNYKWFVLAFNAGIMVYDSGSDLASTADDRYKLLNTSNTVLPTNSVNTITVDRSGDVWVGTAQGAISFECGSNIFDANCRGSRRIVTVNGFNGYLLATEDVRAIAVDGANRKWFGTGNGIFVQSPSGNDQVATYTTTNSPLLDNGINAIAINQKNGEVFIGTEKGIISLRTDATLGGKFTRPDVYAYPNPVRPDYQGPIAVYGVAEDANIKITDVSGKLIWQGKANGGQAIWNGTDYTGRRAATGVYLVFATSANTFEAPDAAIAKIVFVH